MEKLDRHELEMMKSWLYEEKDIIGKEKVNWSQFFNGEDFKESEYFVRAKKNDDRIITLSLDLDSGKQLFPPVVDEKDRIVIGHLTMFAHHYLDDWPEVDIIRVRNKPFNEQIVHAIISNEGPAYLWQSDILHICDVLVEKNNQHQCIQILQRGGISLKSATRNVQKAILRRNNRVCRDIISKIQPGVVFTEKFIEKICNEAKAITPSVFSRFVKKYHPEIKINEKVPKKTHRVCSEFVREKKNGIISRFSQFNISTGKFWTDTTNAYSEGKIDLKEFIGIYRLYEKKASHQFAVFNDQAARIRQKLGKDAWQLDKKRRTRVSPKKEE